MALQLDHTIVPAYRKEESAAFIAHILNGRFEGTWKEFALVRINDVLTLDFVDEVAFGSHHYAFLASDEEFDTILRRLVGGNHSFGSSPRGHSDGRINNLHKGRGFYFKCQDNHLWEVLTHSYVVE
ncbi:MAG: VOC family protein [Gammaproteobacteria bacterium]|nr:VOC family protein [Gammaproteobacteria bacterium]